MKRIVARSVALAVVAIAGSAFSVRYGAEAARVGDSDWSDPVNLVVVNSASGDQNVFLSKDKLSLYFTSNRPGGLGALDIYVSHRASILSEWEPPVNLGPPVNTTGNDFGPSLSTDGQLLFFASNRPGGQGAADIWVSRRSNPNDDFGWEDPTNVGSPINTSDAEQAPFYFHNAEDGSAVLYFARGAQPLQLQDLYYAPVGRHGDASGGEVYVAELNSGVNDFAVTLRTNGRELFFTSPRTGTLGDNDIWTSTRQSIHDAWNPPENAGVPLNSTAHDVTPHLSFDGRTLIFASTRPGGRGGNDLWMSTRTRAQ